MRNQTDKNILGYKDVKHLIRIYSYTYTIDYLNLNDGTRINEIDARPCNKSDWQVSDLVME